MHILAAYPLAFLAFASANAPAAPPASAPQPAAPAASAARNGDIRLATSDHCRSDRVRTAFELNTVPAQRLDRLPAGNLDLAVMREVNGCPEPVTIRENYGAMGMRATPARRPERPALPRARLLDR